MKSIRNEALFKRQERMGLVANLGGMAMLVAAVFVLFDAPGQLGRYFLFLLGGILLVQAGLYFGRLGKRVDLEIDKALKSLDNSYSIYHHTTPVQHLLTAPNGAWIIIPRHTKGVIHYNKDKQKWENRERNLLRRFWRWLTGEKLGRPHFEALIEADRMDAFLQSKWDAKEDIPVHAVALFLDEDSKIDAGDAPFPAVSLKKLKSTVTSDTGQKSISKASLNRMNRILSE